MIARLESGAENAEEAQGAEIHLVDQERLASAERSLAGGLSGLASPAPFDASPLVFIYLGLGALGG